jgi:hypothetical protein
MTCTRFSDDPARQDKRLQESTFLGRYQLDTPGPGVLLPFQEDPHVRLQSWGANQRTQTLAAEQDLRGLGRALSRGDTYDYRQQAPATQAVVYPSQGAWVDQSRASHPAWQYRDLEHSRWETPWLPPQSWSHIQPSFECRVSTRHEQR